MPYSIPTLPQLVESGQTDLESALDTPLPAMGVEQALNVSVSGAVRDLYDYQSWIVRQIIPTSESDEQSVVDVARFEGVIRKIESSATGPVTFTGATAIPAGALMKHQDGRTYRVTDSGDPSGGTVVVAVEADIAGTAGNLPAGEELKLTSPVPGVRSAGVSGEISGGADIEPIERLLERLWYRKRYPPMGGTVYDYVNWCLEMPGVTRAWAVDRYHGGSTVGYCWVYDDREEILPNAADRVAMSRYIYRHEDPATGVEVGRPGGIEPILIPLSLKDQDITILLSVNTPEQRALVEANVRGVFGVMSPGDTLRVNDLITAIGIVPGVGLYDIDLDSDVESEPFELHVPGALTWRTM